MFTFEGLTPFGVSRGEDEVLPDRVEYLSPLDDWVRNTSELLPWFRRMPGVQMYERQGPVTGPPVREMPGHRDLTRDEWLDILNQDRLLRFLHSYGTI